MTAAQVRTLERLTGKVEALQCSINGYADRLVADLVGEAKSRLMRAIREAEEARKVAKS